MYTLDIGSITRHSADIATITFTNPFDAVPSPGQFVMVWVPGVDEFPMSLSIIENDHLGITVRSVGPGTESLLKLEEGSTIGIRGPYGHGYTAPKKDDGPILLIGGGTGIASLMPLARKAKEDGIDVHFALGARTKDELIFTEELKNILGAGLHIATDDGSTGYHGFVTDLAASLVDEYSIKRMYTCGPEIMMVKLMQLADSAHIHFEASLERYMKCGVGICDICAIGRYRVCKDGPVFPGDILRTLDDFGRYRRAPSGKKVKL